MSGICRTSVTTCAEIGSWSVLHFFFFASICEASSVEFNSVEFNTMHVDRNPKKSKLAMHPLHCMRMQP